MTRRVQKLNFHIAYKQLVPRFNLGHVIVGNTRHLLETICLKLVGVNFHRSFFKQIRNPCDGILTEGSTTMIGVVMSDKRCCQLIVSFVNKIQQSINIPRRVYHGYFAGGFRSDKISKILHRTNLDLLDDEFVL